MVVAMLKCSYFRYCSRVQIIFFRIMFFSKKVRNISNTRCAIYGYEKVLCDSSCAYAEEQILIKTNEQMQRCASSWPRCMGQGKAKSIAMNYHCSNHQRGS
jgi:hypothetical protein